MRVHQRPVPPPATAKSRFDGVATVYDVIADAGSFGAASRSKSEQAQEIRTGDRVLYAGAGSGADAVQAAKAGGEVTVVDLSQRMLDRTAGRFDRSGLPVHLVQGDILEHAPEKKYDVVAANYFLNVFEPKTMRQVVAHLAALVKPGGKLLIADFARPKDNRMARAFQKANHYFAVSLFKFVARGDVHDLHDPVAELQKLGFTIERERHFGPAGWYSAIVARAPLRATSPTSRAHP